MGFLSRLFGREDAAITDARRIYMKLMAQSRRPNFFGEGRFADTYEGRIDVLTLHIAGILSNLNRFGENGERLGQAIFDEMKDDFEVALREEALSDASVKKRIQPMISLFYDRVKIYAEALHHDDKEMKLRVHFEENLRLESDDATFSDKQNVFVEAVSSYLVTFDELLSSLSLGQIALTEFEFPPLWN